MAYLLGGSAGETCSGTSKMLYPIHRSGIGACTQRCPTSESADRVNGHKPEDKAKMVCMSKEDFANPKFTRAAAAGQSSFCTNDTHCFNRSVLIIIIIITTTTTITHPPLPSLDIHQKGRMTGTR